jgi:hypothetical protein
MSSEEEAVAWLRQRIRERLYLARNAIELGNAAEWTELSSGVLMTIAPDAPQDRWDGVHPMGDSSLTRLMEANDPQDTIARCEAELAILDKCEKALKVARTYKDGDGVLALACAKTWLDAVHLLAGGYKHRLGFPALLAAAD